jgi:hypothetical protein
MMTALLGTISRRWLYAVTFVIVLFSLAVAFSVVNSSKDTCSLVGCPGWRHAGGIGWGMPVPSGGWEPGQTQWR